MVTLLMVSAMTGLLVKAAGKYQRPPGACYEAVTRMDVALLRKVALFEGLTQGQLQKVAGHRRRARVSHRDRTSSGRASAAQAMYVVVEGKVRISKQVPGIGEEALAILEPGQYFGEMAVIEDSPRSRGRDRPHLLRALRHRAREARRS